MQERYLAAERSGKTQLLSEMECMTSLHRKSLIALMHSNLGRMSQRKQPGRSYGPEVDDAIRVIWETLDYPCPERLTPALSEMAAYLALYDELIASPQLLAQLDRISVSTETEASGNHRCHTILIPNPYMDPSFCTRDVSDTRLCSIIEESERMRG